MKSGSDDDYYVPEDKPKGYSKRDFDQVSQSPDSEVDELDELFQPQGDVFTAVTSLAPTPDEGFPPAKKIRIAPEHNISSEAHRIEYAKRHDQFLRAHADVFLAVLPEKNHVANLLKLFPPGSIHKEVVQYRKLEQPKTIQGGTMKDYQLHGLSFLAYHYENGQNCILADEMGLGKTLQTLSLLAYIHETHGIKGPHLLICPLSVLSSWITEVSRWLPSFSFVRFHGPMTERSRLKNVIASDHPDLVITTYEAYNAESVWFKHRRWGACVLDEGHKIKNHESNVSQNLHGIGANTRIILSGTPLQNNLMELWALLHFLYPHVFTINTLKKFKDSFNLTSGLYDQSFLQKSQKLLEVIMIRRTKEGVSDELSIPPREEITMYIPLSPVQRFWYKRLLTRADSMTLTEIFGKIDVKKKKKGRAPAALLQQQQQNGGQANVAQEEEGEEDLSLMEVGDAEAREQVQAAMAAAAKPGEGAWSKMMNLLMQLRKVCDHPYLLPNAEAEPFEVSEHIVASSSKLILLDKILADLIPKGEKVLIFSGFTRMLDLLEDFMTLRGYKYARLDGSTSRPRRSLDIKLFQQENSPYQCYCISTRAGGLGINLTVATTVILFDQDWNPQVDIQAISRAHRIGQLKHVKVYRFVTQDSVEEQALTRLRKKLYLSAKIMGNFRNATSIKELNESELAESKTAKKETEDAPRMTRNELAMILRGGTGALGRWESGSSDAFADFRAATFADLVEKGRNRDETKELEIINGTGGHLTEEHKKRIEEEEAEAERLLLAGKEAIETRKFEGTVHKQTNADIRREWQATMARSRDSRTVMIDGFAVSKESMACGNWEAVKTITSDPEMVKKLSNDKKRKAKFEHQDYCIVCKDGGEVYHCASCPRVSHGPCSGYTDKELAAMMSWFCSQHNCADCRRTTQEAGGLLFRCQFCPQAFCEDCLLGDIEPVGEVLPEFLLLGMGKRSQAYFIRCPDCIDTFIAEPDVALAWKMEEAENYAKLKALGIDIP